MTEPTFDRFDQTDAWNLGHMMREAAIERGFPIAIDIRRGDAPLFSVMLEGASEVNFDWARRKRNLVLLTGTSSWQHSINKTNGTDVIAMMGLDPRDYTPHGGCVPVRVSGAGIVATVTVSGLPQKQDHEFALEMLNAYRELQ